MEVVQAVHFALSAFQLAPLFLALVLRAAEALHYGAHADVPEEDLSVHATCVDHRLVFGDGDGFYDAGMAS